MLRRRQQAALPPLAAEKCDDRLAAFSPAGV
jgi:hypothetical protein